MKHYFLASLLLIGGCNFKVSGGKPNSGEQDLASGGGGGSELGPGGPIDMMAGGGQDLPPGATVDLMTPTDLAPACVANSKRCSAGGSLETCRADGGGFDSMACAFGCAATGAGPHCKVFTPSPPIVKADFSYVGLTAISYSTTGNYLFDTFTGKITGPAGTLRDANGDPTLPTVVTTNGAAIGFHRTNGVGVWSFASLTVGANAVIIFVDSGDLTTTAKANQYAAAFASEGDVHIQGSIDVRGYAISTMNPPRLCGGTVPGPGGGVGGFTGVVTFAAGGTGNGATSATSAVGGGGAGFGGLGSLGGGASAGTVPAAYGTAELNPFVAGSGGGAGGGANGIAGGGGGGAFEMVSLTAISISGTVNAGGCGGSGSNQDSGGGGGGSGGAILLEARTIDLTASATPGLANISANGGGGGGGAEVGGASGTTGKPGQPSTTTAGVGGSGGGNSAGASGGDGGLKGSIAGKVGGASNSGDGDGGGGGAVGRIRLNTINATVSGSGSQLSPAISDTSASLGMLNLQ